MQSKAQVLIEAVIYILIALVIMGIVLGIAYPEIERMQDKAIIDQSINMLENIDSLIVEMRRGGAGNQRLLDLGLKKGTLTIDGENDNLIFEMESEYTYSEPGQNYDEGNIIVKTTKMGGTNIVKLTLRNGGNYNLTYDGKDMTKELTKTPVPYKLLFSNRGEDESETTVIDIKIN